MSGIRRGNSPWWVAALACATLGGWIPARADGPLYGITGAGATSGVPAGRGITLPADESFLFQLDATTGAVVDSIGPVVLGSSILRHVTALAFNPISGDLFAVQSSEVDSVNTPLHSSRLLKIDPSTGAATQIGVDFDPNTTANFPDMSFSANGTCYAWSEFDDDLWTIDINTGVPTLVGASGIGTAQTGLAFDRNDNLFVKNRQNLFSVNRFTGAAAVVDTIPTNSTRNGLEFDANGTIYTLDANRALATIDRATNTVNSLNPASSPQLSSISFRPDPALPAVSAAAGADVVVTANLRGAASNVRLLFRRGGDSGFQQLTMSLSSLRTGGFAATIPGTNLTGRGVQYYVQADIAGGASLTAPLGAPTTAFQNLSVAVTNFPMTPLPAGQYILAGAPIDANAVAAEAVFDELGPYKQSVWRYGTFDPVAGRYLEPPQAAGARPGQGFWIIAKDASAPTVSGRSSNLAGNFRIVVQPGFNQIANPFDFNVDAADVVLPAGVESNFISFANGGYVTGNTTLTPGTGYWIRNNSGSAQTIQVPPIGAGAALRGLPRDVSTLSPEESGWSVQVTAAAGAFWDRDNRFGMRPGATPSRDALDFGHPPAPPQGYAALSFRSGDGVPLLSDYRPENGHGDTWELTFRSDQRGAPFHIEFAAERALPSGWRMIAIEGHGLREVDLGATPSLSGVVTTNAFERTWTIAAGDEGQLDSARARAASGATRFVLGDPIPNPAGRGMQVSLDLEMARAGRAEIRIYDVAGRVVRTLSDQTRSQGAFRITWDGKDDAGRPAGAGVYFIRARTAGDKASRKVVLAR